MRFYVTLISVILSLATPAFAQNVADADLTISKSAVKKFVSGKTIRTYTRKQGNRIEYFAPNGKIYVWPARLNLIIGTWAVCDREAKMVDPTTQKVKEMKLASICRKLPVEGNPDQTWNSPWATYKPTIQEYQAGDLFDLSGRTDAPYPMGKRSEPFAYFIKKIEK